MTKWLTLIARVVAVLMLFACVAGVGQGKRLLIGYGAPELYGGQLDIQNGLVRHAQALGFEVLTTNANGDAVKQANQIDDFIAMRVDAIVVVPVDSAAICSSIRKARQAGIPFYTIDRAPIGCTPDSAPEMVVLADNYMAGRQAGEAMVKLLTQKYGKPQGTVLELQGDLGTNVAILRGRGFNDVIKQYPNIKVIQKPTNWQADRFAAITRDVLSVQKVDGIYLHSDNIGIPAVIPTLRQLGLLKKRGEKGHIFITGVDGGPAMLQAIREGWADAAASQPLNDFGIVAEFILARLQGKEIKEQTVTREGALWSPAQVRKADWGGWELLLATTLVTPENVNDPRLYGNQPR
ncbi:MAG: sugar ABC transporter substrate-binding protein [Firmicutes bacterium]|nr:sugar ABC transporter substrate-binding protein [Bacillota bacterium]